MRQLPVLLVVCLLAALAPANEKKPPAGPVVEGMVFEGVFKTGEPNRFGVLTKPYIVNFQLRIDSVDGEAFVGTWTWDDRDVTEVQGKVKKSGAMTMRFTKNIKGRQEAAFDGQAAGKVTAKTLQLRYVRPSANRIGLAEGKVTLVVTKE